MPLPPSQPTAAAAAGICRHGLASMHSVCGYISEVGAATLHVRRGLGCCGTWTAYPLLERT